MSATNESTGHRYTVNDFKFGKEIGHGSFSTVMLAKELRMNRQCAAKVIDKSFILRQKITNTAMIEKEALKMIKCELFIELICTFQDNDRLYFILSYASHGELLTHLNKLSCFDLECTKFYTAEIIIALEYLHLQAKIIHRDIKPENILLSDSMHIKICDFGSCLILSRPDLKAPSFTGTPQFVSPEMLGLDLKKDDSSEADDDIIDQQPSARLANGSGPISDPALLYLMDFWALGCIVYQLLSGRMVFHVSHGQHEYEIFQKIKALNYTFPPGFDQSARDLVERLLVLDPRSRLGNPLDGGHTALKSHILFQGMDWETLITTTPPLLAPNIAPVVQDNWDEIPRGYEAAWRFNIKKELEQFELADKQQLLQSQERQNPFHKFVRGRLIIKQGILYKRRGLFSQKRMFLLTEGPHLFYVDPDAMVFKKEVNLQAITSVEVKSSKIFYIHTKKRTYFLEDPSAKSDDWKQSIESICLENYPKNFKNLSINPPGSNLLHIASSSND